MRKHSGIFSPLAKGKQRPARTCPWAKEQNEKRGHPKKRPQGKLVATGDSPAEPADPAQASLAGSLRQPTFPAGDEEHGNNSDPDNRTKKRTEENGQEGPPKPEKRSDHEHHFYVPKAHAIATSDELVDHGGCPQESTAENGPEESIEHSDGPQGKTGTGVPAKEHSGNAVLRRHSGGKCEADSYTKPVYFIRKDALPVVGDNQHD